MALAFADHETNSTLFPFSDENDKIGIMATLRLLGVAEAEVRMVEAMYMTTQIKSIKGHIERERERERGGMGWDRVGKGGRERDEEKGGDIDEGGRERGEERERERERGEEKGRERRDEGGRRG